MGRQNTGLMRGFAAAAVLTVAVALSGAVGGCGSSDPGGNSGVGGGGGSGMIIPTSGPFEPLAVGATWTYDVNDKGVPFQKTSTVEAMEDIGGAKAGITGFRLRDTFPNETQLTWYEVSGSVVKRHREMSLDTTGATKSEDFFDPYRLRVDESPEHMTPGATWTQTFTNAHTSRTKPASNETKTDGWNVDAVDETVTVKAGTFASLKVTRNDAIDGSTKTYWFVRGVGKVKESTSGGHTEELTSYTIP